MAAYRFLILGVIFLVFGIFVTVSESQLLIEANTSNSGEELESTGEFYSTGLLLLQKQDYENALPFFEKAVKKDPTSAKAYYLLGWNYNALEHYDEAIDAYKQAIQIKPDYFEAYYNLALIYDTLRQPNEAIEVFKQAIQIRPTSAESYYSIGREYSILKHREQAIKSYQEAIRLNPNYPKAHYAIGREYLTSGNKKNAFKEYKILMRIDKQLANDLFPPPSNKFFRYTSFSLSVPFGIVMIGLTLIFAIRIFYLFKKTLQFFYKMYFFSLISTLPYWLVMIASLLIFEISPFKKTSFANLSVGVIMAFCLILALYFLVRGMIIYCKTKKYKISDLTKFS